MPAKYVKPKAGVSGANLTKENTEPVKKGEPLSRFLLVTKAEATEFFRNRNIAAPPANIFNNPRVIELTDAGKWEVSQATGTIIADNLNRRNAIMIESYGVKQEGENACTRCRGTLNPARPPHLIFSTGCYKANKLAGGACGNCTAGGEQSRCSIRTGAPLPPAPSNPAPPRPAEAYGTRRSSRALNQEPLYTADQLPALRRGEDKSNQGQNPPAQQGVAPIQQGPSRPMILSSPLGNLPETPGDFTPRQSPPYQNVREGSAGSNPMFFEEAERWRNKDTPSQRRGGGNGPTTPIRSFAAVDAEMGYGNSGSNRSGQSDLSEIARGFQNQPADPFTPQQQITGPRTGLSRSQSRHRSDRIASSGNIWDVPTDTETDEPDPTPTRRRSRGRQNQEVLPGSVGIGTPLRRRMSGSRGRGQGGMGGSMSGNMGGNQQRPREPRDLAEAVAMDRANQTRGRGQGRGN